MKMIEQVIGKWLNKLLGGFVEEIDSDSINVAMLAGRAVLENLTVKPTCMQELGMPVVLNAGTVGRIEMDIPTGSLKSKPVCVTIRDVLISVSPNPHVNLKKVQLEKHLFDWDRQGVDETQIDPHSKLGRILAKVADNIKITVENVHLRFEDTTSCQASWHRDRQTSTGRCFSMGFTLDRFVLEGCVIGPDGAWQARSVRQELRFLNKTVVIGTRAQEMTGKERRLMRTSHPAGFGMYLHDQEQPLQSAREPERMQEWIAEMRGYIAHADYPTSNAWVVGPISLSSKVSLDKNGEDEFRPCSSRLWTEEPVPEEEFHTSEIGPADELHVEVSVTDEDLQAASGHFLQLHWAFETAKDGIGFGVSLLPGVTDGAICGDSDGRDEPILHSAVNLQWAGKGGFHNAYLELNLGSMLSFRDQKGGKEIALASVAGAKVASPKNPRKGHPYSFRLDLPSPDTRGFSKYICSVETKGLCAEWVEAIKSAATPAVTLPEDVPPSTEPSEQAPGVPQMITIEGLQRSESHLQRVHGHVRVQVAGVYVVHWGNALTKTRGRALRHAVWLQKVSKSGSRSVKVPCKVHVRQINPKWSGSPAKAGAKTTSPANDPKDGKLPRGRSSLEGLNAPAAGLKASAARRLDDVHRDASHGARNEIELVVDKIPLNVNHAAFRNLVAMQVWYSNISRWQLLQHLRPSGPGSADVSRCPRAWWVFAIKSVIQESTNIFKTLSRFVRGSREYAELFKRRYAAGRAWLEPLSASDQARITELEQLLPIDMILKRRNTAWLQLHQEDQAKDHKKRDLAEMEAELTKLPVEQWLPASGDAKSPTVRKQDRVLYKGWLLSDPKEKKVLSKSRFVTVVDVKSLADTHHSGWMLLRQRRTDAQETWDRYWFRLKGQSLYYFSGIDEDKPRREIHLSTVSHVQLVPGSAASLEIITSDRKFVCKCDRTQDCTAWAQAFTQCFARAGAPRDFYRWLLVFKGDSPGTKPLSVVPLTSRSFTWKKPSVAVRDCEQSARVLCVVMLDFSVRQWVLASKDVSQFGHLDELLTANAAQLLNDGSLPADKTTLSANQQALLEDDEEEEDALDDDLDENDEDRLDDSNSDAVGIVHSAPLDYIKNRFVLNIGRIVVTMGLEHSIDWVGINLDTLRVEVSSTSHAASSIELKLSDLTVEDRYTRDTTFPLLLQRFSETTDTKIPGGATTMLRSQDEGEDAPLIRFRYKKTYREQLLQQPDRASRSEVIVSPSRFTERETDGGGGGGEECTTRPRPIKLDNPVPEGLVETDVFVQLFVQPIKVVINPELMPLLLAFTTLRNDESIKAMGGMVMNEIKAIDDRSSRLMDSLSKIEQKTQEVHRQVQVEIGSIEVLLAEDLCKMRSDANAVVLRIRGIRLGNSEGCEPSPAGPNSVGRGLSISRMLSVDFSAEASARDGLQEFRGELQQLEIFTCNRDDTEFGICQILAPVTAPLSVRLADDNTFFRAVEHTGAAGAGDTPPAENWLTAELDVDGIQLCVSKQGLSTLVKVGRATAQTVKRKSFSPSSWGFSSSSGRGGGSISSATDSIKQKLEKRRKKRELNQGSVSPESTPGSSPTAAHAAAAAADGADTDTATGAGLLGQGAATLRMAAGWRQKSETIGASRVAARSSGGGALFHGKLKVGIIQLVVDLADDTGGVRDVSGTISKAKIVKQAVKLARSSASSSVRSQVVTAATGGTGLGVSTLGLGAVRLGVSAARGKSRSASLNPDDTCEDEDDGSGVTQFRSNILQLEVQNFEFSHVIGALALEETTRMRVETVYTLFHGRRHVSRLPVGVAYITKHKPGYGKSRSKTSVWIYKPSSPDSLVQFKKLTDVLNVIDVADLQEFLPLLRTGMRTGSLVDGFLSLNGIGGEKLFPSEWLQSINALEEAAGLSDRDDGDGAEASEAGGANRKECDLQSDLQSAVQLFATTMLGNKMDTLTNFASAALDLKRTRQSDDAPDDGGVATINKLQNIGATVGIAAPPQLISVVTEVQMRVASGTLQEDAEALKAAAEEKLKNQAVGMVQSKAQQFSQSMKGQSGARAQMLSSVSSASPGVKTALEQLQEQLASGEMSKERVMSVLRQGKESVTSEIEEAKTAAIGVIAGGDGGKPVDWLKQTANRIGEEQMARVRERLLSEIEPAMRTQQGGTDGMPHPSAPVVQSVVESVLDASTGMALQMAAMAATRVSSGTSSAGPDDDSSNAAEAQLASLGLQENVVVPLLNAIDEEVARRTQELLAQQELLKAALAAAEARAEQVQAQAKQGAQ